MTRRIAPRIAPRLAGLCLVALATLARAEPPHEPPRGVDEAWLASLALPPLASTRDIIAALPQVQAAQAGIAQSQARARQLAVGSHEWSLKLGAQQRNERGGPQYAESDVALERALRWGGKAETDRALGEAGQVVGRSAYADTWHESVRALLVAWYDWQRERSQAGVLAQQAQLAQRQRDVAARRVQAGEAPRMDLLMAQAEWDRALASEQQARGREQVQRQQLQQHYPGLLLVEPQAAAPWPSLTQDTQAWVQRILEDNHEIELAQAEAQVARLHSERARQDTRADPLVGVRAARERGGQDQIVGLYVTLPLSGTYRDAQQQVALAQLAAAEQRLAQTRRHVQATAQRTVLQAQQALGVAQRLVGVQQSQAAVAELATKAYGLGELTLTEALQARRLALDAALAAEVARWDALQGVARLLADAHLLWSADAH